MISIKNIKYLELKKFDWKLFFRLIALSLLPFLLQTIETFVVSINISCFGKSDLVLIKDWSRIGAFSGLQQFIANVVYALMIVRIVNEVSESGNYWLCNNFIWGFLLLPVNALCEVIRKDCKDGYKNLRQSNYYIILFAIFVLWALSITFWMPFFKVVEHLENYRRIFEICLMMIPFFIPYSLQQVPDNIFIGLGKTKYNFINTALVNFIYYGVWFALYKTKAINFDMNMIILMFGFGMVVSCAISFIQEKVFFTKKS